MSVSSQKQLTRRLLTDTSTTGTAPAILLGLQDMRSVRVVSILQVPDAKGAIAYTRRSMLTELLEIGAA